MLLLSSHRIELTKVCSEFIPFTPEMATAIHHTDEHRTILTSLGRPVQDRYWYRAMGTPFLSQSAFGLVQDKIAGLEGDALQAWLDERKVQIACWDEDSVAIRGYVQNREDETLRASSRLRIVRYSAILAKVTSQNFGDFSSALYVSLISVVTSYC